MVFRSVDCIRLSERVSIETVVEMETKDTIGSIQKTTEP